MSSPIVPPAMPIESTQPQPLSLSTPFSGPGAQNDPFATMSQFSAAELRPPTSLMDSILNTGPPGSAFDLFSEHLSRAVIPRYSAKIEDGINVEFLAQDAWETMSDGTRKEWEAAEQAIRTNMEKSKAAEEWKKTVGNRSRPSGTRTVDIDNDDDDDDVVMVASDEATRH